MAVGERSTDEIFADLAARMTQILNQNQQQNHGTSLHETNTQIGIKLDGTNYALWSQVVEMYISGKDKLGYINGDNPEPAETDPGFRKWRTENAVVKGWLLNSLDTTLIGNFIRFPTAKAVWDNIATTYFDGTDTLQIYDLKRKVSKLKQDGGSIETFYNNLQGLWREIDFRRPNPMTCNDDISKYNSIIQEDRVYTFLYGLDDRLDKIRGDVLQLKPLPTVEEVYAQVRREDLRQSVMTTSNEAITSGGVMLSRGNRKPVPVPYNLVADNQLAGKQKVQREGNGCAHCGSAKHTRDTCFKLHGYPEWWHELKARKKSEVAGRASLATTESRLSLIPAPEATTSNNEPTNSGYSHEGDYWSWY